MRVVAVLAAVFFIFFGHEPEELEDARELSELAAEDGEECTTEQHTGSEMPEFLAVAVLVLHGGLSPERNATTEHLHAFWQQMRRFYQGRRAFQHG